MAKYGNFTFGDDSSSGFDWGSLVNNLVTQAGTVTAAAINQGNTGVVSPYGPQPTITTTNSSMLGGLTNNSLVLLGVAGVLGFVLFKKIKARR